MEPSRPSYGTPAHDVPVHGAPIRGVPVYGTPVYGTPVYDEPASGYRVDDVLTDDAPAVDRDDVPTADAGARGIGHPYPVRAKPPVTQVPDRHDLGTVSLGLALIAYFTVARVGGLSVVLGAAAAVTGIMALRTGRRRRAIAGLVLGLLAIQAGALDMFL